MMALRSLLRSAKRSYYRLLTTTFGDSKGLVLTTPRSGRGKGLKYKLDLSSGNEDGYYTGKYDCKILDHLNTLIKPGMVVWEFGVFVGYYTTIFSRWCGPNGKVVAFEPNPDNRARASENARLNGHTNTTFCPFAIGGPLGTIDFIINSNTNSHIPGVFVGATMEEYTSRVERKEKILRVECYSPDQLLERTEIPKPDFIKIDIEGAELYAMQYMENICKTVRPLICLELHNPECDRAAFEFSQKHHYQIFVIEKGIVATRYEDVGGTLLLTPKAV